MTQTRNKAILQHQVLPSGASWAVFFVEIGEIFCIDEKRTLQTIVICLPRFCAE